ncbi:MAG TPA: hypothetical protein PLQ89_05375 [Phycisphaerae bacterium]|nr:hypothetical protein [Phycisphaerae bacterium]
MRQIIFLRAVLACLCLVVVKPVFAGTSNESGKAAPESYAGVAWPAIDGLGRTLPVDGEVSPPKRDRFVGIFYFLWLNEVHNKSPHYEGPYDVSKILARDPDALQKPDSPLWGPIGRSHYWGEPLYGYYLSTDPWVLRRHAWLLSDAGIDTLIFDTTNAITYRDVYMKLCEVFRQVRQDGGHTPQISFMVNTQAGKTAEQIYNELYKPGLFPELWFHWQGKPLMICDPAEASPELKEFFTLRKAHWPFQQVNTPYAWHWEAAYPQHYGFTDDPDRPEQVNVSVAQNLRVADGAVTNMSNGDARGRSFHNGKMDTSTGAVNYGHNAQEQWERAIELDPPFIMVTGWNEWIAGRWGQPGGPIVFVDQFNQEYSRDIEPVKGMHGDNYYWQMVANIRRYKGAAPLPRASAPRTIRIDGDFSQWQDVGPEFRDHVGETLPRDVGGAGGLHYTNRTGRNDIVAAKVARDADHVFFHVRTREPIRMDGDANGLWLLIDADRNARTGWEGYEFIVNREATGATDRVWLEKHTGSWAWQRVCEVELRVADRELHLAIPRNKLGLAQDGIVLDFKWMDNVQEPGNPLDAYVSGDVAPEGRFRYRYVAD